MEDTQALFSRLEWLNERINGDYSDSYIYKLERKKDEIFKTLSNNDWPCSDDVLLSISKIFNGGKRNIILRIILKRNKNQDFRNAIDVFEEALEDIRYNGHFNRYIALVIKEKSYRGKAYICSKLYELTTDLQQIVSEQQSWIDSFKDLDKMDVIICQVVTGPDLSEISCTPIKYETTCNIKRKITRDEETRFLSVKKAD